MQVNKKLSPKMWDSIWNELLDGLEKSGDRTQIAVLITNTLSDAEKVMMAKRMMVGVLTLSKWKPVDIAHTLCLSKATVYKNQRFLSINPIYRALLLKLYPTKIKPPDKDTATEVGLSKLLDALFEGRQNRTKLQYLDLG